MSRFLRERQTESLTRVTEFLPTVLDPSPYFGLRRGCVILIQVCDGEEGLLGWIEKESKGRDSK
jgi:hypothetical protein